MPTVPLNARTSRYVTESEFSKLSESPVPITACAPAGSTVSARPSNAVPPNVASCATNRPLEPSDHADRSMAISTTPPGSVPLSPMATNQHPASDEPA